MMSAVLSPAYSRTVRREPMGILDWIFGPTKPVDPITESTKRLFETEIRKRGGQVIAWSGTVASVQKGEEKHEFDLINLWQTVSRQGRDIAAQDIALHLDKLDAAAKKHALLADLKSVTSMLRPRITSKPLADSQPKLCRLDYIPDILVRTLTVDFGDTASYVTDTVLRDWKISFDEVFKSGLSELAKASNRDQFRPLEGADDILVNDCSDGIASSRCLILDELFPEAKTGHGVLFSVPNNDVLLVHVVKASSSAAALMALQNVTANLFQTRPHSLVVDVFWHRNSKVDRMNIGLSVSKSGELNMDVVCAGVTEEFLKLTGAVK
jgi:hypothetical protein